MFNLVPMATFLITLPDPQLLITTTRKITPVLTKTYHNFNPRKPFLKMVNNITYSLYHRVQ